MRPRRLRQPSSLAAAVFLAGTSWRPSWREPRPCRRSAPARPWPARSDLGGRALGGCLLGRRLGRSLVLGRLDLGLGLGRRDGSGEADCGGRSGGTAGGPASYGRCFGGGFSGCFVVVEHVLSFARGRSRSAWARLRPGKRALSLRSTPAPRAGVLTANLGLSHQLPHSPPRSTSVRMRRGRRQMDRPPCRSLCPEGPGPSESRWASARARGRRWIGVRRERRLVVSTVCRVVQPQPVSHMGRGGSRRNARTGPARRRDSRAYGGRASSCVRSGPRRWRGTRRPLIERARG